MGRPQAKESRWLLEAENGKKMDFSLEPSEENAVLPTPWLYPSEIYLDFWPLGWWDNKFVLFEVTVCSDLLKQQ